MLQGANSTQAGAQALCCKGRLTGGTAPADGLVDEVERPGAWAEGRGTWGGSEEVGSLPTCTAAAPLLSPAPVLCAAIPHQLQQVLPHASHDCRVLAHAPPGDGVGAAQQGAHVVLEQRLGGGLREEAVVGGACLGGKREEGRPGVAGASPCS